MFDEQRLAIQEASEHAIANLQFGQFILIAFVSIMILFLIVIVANLIIRAKKIADERMDCVKPQSYLVVTKNNEWATTTTGRRATWWKLFWSEF